MYKKSGYGIIFDSAGSWSFHNGIAKNIIVFDVDNSSSSHSDNRKNNFSVLHSFAKNIGKIAQVKK